MNIKVLLKTHKIFLNLKNNNNIELLICFKLYVNSIISIEILLGMTDINR